MAKRRKQIWIDGIVRTAAAIAKQFSTSCSRQDINYWKSLNPPFPAPRANNKYNQAECFAWFEKHVLPKRKAEGQGDLFGEAGRAKSEREIIRRDREKRLELEEMGKLIDRDLAQQTTNAVLLKYHSFVRAEVEMSATARRREKLVSLGATAEIIAAFYEWDLGESQATIDRIDERCAQEGRDAG